MIITDLEEREIAKFLKNSFTNYIKGKTFLITGAKGIVGTGIIKSILFENQMNNTNAHIIASTREPFKIPSYYEDGDDIEFCKFGKEAEACADKHVDFIIHAAAPTSNKVFKALPIESLKVIIDGTESILQIAKAHKASMIFLSSEEVYGITDNGRESISEDYVGAINSLNTRSSYPLGKKVAELCCRSYFECEGVDVKIIRPTVIMGLWQPYDYEKVEAEILRCILERKNLFLKSDGSTQKCVIYSLEAITAVLTVLFKGKGGEAYNATNPDTFCSVKDRAYSAFTEFNNLFGSNSPQFATRKFISNITIEFASIDTSVSEGYLPKRSLLENISKIRSLGWNPQADMSYIYKIDLERFRK